MFETALPDVGQVTVDFLDGYFIGNPTARTRLLADGNHASVTTLRGS
jgi:hypothetical protein